MQFILERFLLQRYYRSDRRQILWIYMGMCFLFHIVPAAIEAFNFLRQLFAVLGAKIISSAL